MSATRNNHYVPQWYQEGFFAGDKSELRYLNLEPETILLPNGNSKKHNDKWWYPPSQCFFKRDLYTTFFGEYINDEIERKLFGKIDDIGSKSVRAFIGNDFVQQHDNFQNFFIYIDSQKIRTPKGLDWIQHKYPKLNKLELMEEMQAIQSINCTLWTEGVREIVSAKNSDVKFIISDHPVTVYNYACPPDSEYCTYPNDPSIALKATQTIFPLNNDHALILTNLEYAQEPLDTNPLELRTHAQKIRQSMARTDALIRSRNLNADEVTKINYILKKRAKQFIAAGKEEWLYPEKNIQCDWADLKDILLPPRNQISLFDGEMYIGYKDGSTHYQDAFGRTTPENKYLLKNIDESKIGNNNDCGCGSGKKYKKCCKNTPAGQRTTWKVISIRERNIVLYNAIYDILGLDNGKIWDDVRRELDGKQIKEIYSVYASLWPIETDIYELLPKPDGKLRAMYTGFIDPRTITTALSMTAYFDELLVQHPFVNPNNIRPEFNPIESPHQYKCTILKDIVFLLAIEPFVMSGMVNLIPDPCNFDSYLHRQMLDMAGHRKGEAVFSERDKEISFKLNDEYLLHTISTLPENTKEHYIRKMLPNISDDELKQIALYIKAMAEENPLAPLQDIDLSGNGQLLMTQMAPNYEMALFIAQATGAVIVTDSESRWNEFQQAQYREHGLVSYPWQELSSAFSDINLYANLDDIHKSYSGPEFVAIRKILGEANTMVKEGVHDASKIFKLNQQLLSGFVKINNVSKGRAMYTARMRVLIPKGGFVDKNVQRLFVLSSCEQYLKAVPMVFFIE